MLSPAAPAQNQAQNNGRHAEVQLDKEVAHNARTDHQKHIVDIVIDGISADHTEDKHNGVQPLHRYQADFGEDADSTIAQQAHEDVGHKQRDNDGVDIHRLGAEKQRSRCNALHHQGTQHDGCDGVTRDALILGGTVEENLRRTLVLSDGSFSIFLSHPIALVLLAIAAISLLSPIFLNLWKKRSTNKQSGN